LSSVFAPSRWGLLLSSLPRQAPPRPLDIRSRSHPSEQQRVRRGNGASCPFTSHSAADPTALYLHALVHLQQGTLDDADRLIERLRGRNTQAATGYANKLAPVLAAARANSALKDQFADAVRRFDGNGAASVLGKMDVSPQQRVALGVYIDTYRGRMTSALAALSGASMQKVPPNIRDTLRTELTTATAQFRDITEQLRWYTNSNLGSSACLPADARERSVASGLVLAEYVRLTELGLELFPFNERLMDLAFHGALLSAPYEDVETGRQHPGRERDDLCSLLFVDLTPVACAG
jgi:hypothetical protein